MKTTTTPVHGDITGLATCPGCHQRIPRLWYLRHARACRLTSLAPMQDHDFWHESAPMIGILAGIIVAMVINHLLWRVF